MIDAITLADYEQAEADLRAWEGYMGFVVHALLYVLVNTVLVVINLAWAPGFLWFFLSLIGWGIGLTIHYLFAVRFEGRKTRDWQARVERRAARMRARRAA